MRNFAIENRKDVFFILKGIEFVTIIDGRSLF